MDFVKYSSNLREVFDSELLDLFTSECLNNTNIPKELKEAMHYALFTGGKRLRPVLCLAACQAVSGDYENAIYPSLAIEALHTYTLIHDDMPCMDNDDLRRGLPTVHVKFGYAEAVLAGDALQALAFDLLSRTKTQSDTVVSMLREFSIAAGAGGVIGGQWVDVTAKPPHDIDRIDFVHKHKTADLISCALVIGGIAGKGNFMQIEALREFGLNFGLSFQIVDDLLDANVPGKENELSILRIMDKDSAIRYAKSLSEKALAALDKLLPTGEKETESVMMLRMLAETQTERKF